MRLGLRVGTGCVYGTLQDRQGRAGCMTQTKKERESVFVLLKGWGKGVFMFSWLRKQTEKSNYECGQFMLLFTPKMNCSFFFSQADKCIIKGQTSERCFDEKNRQRQSLAYIHSSNIPLAQVKMDQINQALYYNLVCTILKGNWYIYTMWYASFLKGNWYIQCSMHHS